MGKLVTEVRVESIHLYYLFTVAVGDSSAQGFSFLSASTRDESSQGGKAKSVKIHCQCQSLSE